MLLCRLRTVIGKLSAYACSYGSKICPCPGHEGVWGLEVCLHSFSTSALDGEKYVLRSGLFTWQENHGAPLNRRLGGLKNRSGHFGEEGNLLLLYQCKIFVLCKLYQFRNY